MAIFEKIQWTYSFHVLLPIAIGSKKKRVGKKNHTPITRGGGTHTHTQTKNTLA